VLAENLFNFFFKGFPTVQNLQENTFKKVKKIFMLGQCFMKTYESNRKMERLNRTNFQAGIWDRGYGGIPKMEYIQPRVYINKEYVIISKSHVGQECRFFFQAYCFKIYKKILFKNLKKFYCMASVL